MPLTFAHPAAVLPLKRSGLVFSALLVGALAPDFEYFLRLSTKHSYGHTLPGLFLFTLPVGLAGLWLFHALLRSALLALLPVGEQRRLAPLVRPFNFFPARRFLLVGVSVLLGAVTHIVWDSFTHPGAWPVEHFAPLKFVLWKSSASTIRVHNVLQHGSTLFGFTLLGLAFLRWRRRAAADDSWRPALAARPRWRAIFYLGLWMFAVGFALACLRRQPVWTLGMVQTFVGNLVVGGFDGGVLAVAGLGLWLRRRSGGVLAEPTRAPGGQ